MKILVISDLHITKDSTHSNTPWVAHICQFIKTYYASEVLIIVLGDVVDKGGIDGESAFKAADDIFYFIEHELSSIKYKIIFIPGNHDYCDSNLHLFRHFCYKYQSPSVNFDFSQKTTFHYIVEEFNFIMTDSIRGGDFGIPGRLDLPAIKSCILPDKENIIFMHHSLLFEDTSDHTGVIYLSEVKKSLGQNQISFIIHGHAHAARNFDIDKQCKMIGVGSLGVKDPQIMNESEQFIKIQIRRRRIEAIVNWLWRGGEKCFSRIPIYPDTTLKYEYSDLVPRKLYSSPENHIPRFVMPRDCTTANERVRYLAPEKKNAFLMCVCEKN